MYVYLDHNASTAVDPEVIHCMDQYWRDSYANAGSTHLQGLEVQESVQEAEQRLASFLGHGQIIFTSGATEAINTALKGLAFEERKEIITFSTEHKAVLETCTYLETQGYTVHVLPVNERGEMDLLTLEKTLSSRTLMVWAMYANNETGVLHPIPEIAALCHKVGAYACCDSTAAVGKLDLQLGQADLLTFSAHKYYGPKGIGGLLLRNGLGLTPLIHGGGQQNGSRSGTLPVPLILGMDKAFSLSLERREEEERRIGALRTYLEEELLSVSDAYVHGMGAKRLYTTANLCFPGAWAEELILRLKKVAVSSGSACSAITTRPSHVLLGMGVSPEEALCSLRFSLGRNTTEEQIAYTLAAVKAAVERVRSA